MLTCVKVASSNTGKIHESRGIWLPRRARRSALCGEHRAVETMFQVRIHGRGGQGVVSGAEMLSVAAFLEGRYAQAFPSFGSERMGAPVMAFCRIDDKEIRLREPVLEPDALIIQDPTLLHQVDLFKGLQARRLHPDQLDAQLRGTGARRASRAASGRFRLCTLPGHRARASSTSAARCRTRRCWADLPRSADAVRAGVRSSPRSAQKFPAARSPQATSPPRARPSSSRPR